MLGTENETPHSWAGMEAELRTWIQGPSCLKSGTVLVLVGGLSHRWVSSGSNLVEEWHVEYGRVLKFNGT